MNIFNIFSISGAGMGAQRSRMSVTAGNMANAETTRTPEGGPCQRRNVFFQAIPLAGTFSSALHTTSAKHFSGGIQDQGGGIHSIRMAGIHSSSRPARKVYDPQHPDADGEGYVSYPDINVMEGIGKRLPTLIDDYINSASAILTALQEGINESILDIDDEIAKEETRIDAFEG